MAVIEGLNTAYEVREARSWLKRRLVAVVLTLGMSVFGIAALTILLFGNQFGLLIADKAGFGPAFSVAWPYVQWPLMAIFVLTGFALIYRYAPNVHEQHWAMDPAGCVPGIRLMATRLLRFEVVPPSRRSVQRFLRIAAVAYGADDLVLLLRGSRAHWRRGQLDRGTGRRARRESRRETAR